MSWRCPPLKIKRSGLPNPSTVMWILQLKPPRLRPSACSPFFFGTGCTGMCPHNRAVYHPIFQIGIVSKVSQHPFPYPGGTPAGKAFIHTIPVAIFSGQQAPLCATTPDPLHGFNETTALCLVSHIGIRVL